MVTDLIDTIPSPPLDSARDESHGLIHDDRFRLMVESVADYAIFILDAQGRVLTWNLGAEQTLGYSKDEVLGRHCSTFYLPDAVERRMPEWEMEAATRDGRHDHEDWRVRKDGTRLWTSITTTRLNAPDGTLLGFGKMIRDLTEKRAVEQELYERKLVLKSQLAAAYGQMRSLTDSLTDGLLEVGPDWKILFGNRTAANSLPDFRLGAPVWDCFPDLLGTPVEQHFRTAMAERTHISYENYYPRYDMWFRVKLSPTEDGLSIIYSDITRERKAEDQLKLEQVLREKRIEGLSHMAGGLAHEINNPLAIIRATAADLHDMLGESSIANTNPMRESCESMVFMADRAMRILKGLRGFAREASQDPKEWASLHDIAAECVDMQQSRFDRRAVVLRIAIDDSVPPILCRPVQVSQILTNLLNNALDAIVQSDAVERWVSLTGKQDGGSLVVRVTDSGPGVEEQFRAHLMEPFFTTKVGDLGMGIGLSLSRAIAEDHGGTLALLDGEPHTCFQLTLPIDTEAPHEL